MSSCCITLQHIPFDAGSLTEPGALSLSFLTGPVVQQALYDILLSSISSSGVLAQVTMPNSFYGFWGYELRFFCLCRNCFHPLSHLPSLRLCLGSLGLGKCTKRATFTTQFLCVQTACVKTQLRHNSGMRFSARGTLKCCKVRMGQAKSLSACRVTYVYMFTIHDFQGWAAL